MEHLASAIVTVVVVIVMVVVVAVVATVVELVQPFLLGDCLRSEKYPLSVATLPPASHQVVALDAVVDGRALGLRE